MAHILLTGAAGFIGSHLIDRFLETGNIVTGVDNFIRGTRENIAHLVTDSRFEMLEGDMSLEADARAAFEVAARRAPVDSVWHMAANSDIGAGVADPKVDLRDTYMTTFQALALMREWKVPHLAFASSSAIYGAHPDTIHEDIGPVFPISNYGAMKLASEGSISAAVESFLPTAHIFRFPNVIGPRATHGVIYDLMRKLKATRTELEVLGDGSQEKPYLHVSDLVDAMLFITTNSSERLNVFNIAADSDFATVKFIAEQVIETAAPGTPIRYTGGSRGWVGDVPKYSYSTAKLGRLGWSPSMTSELAVKRAVREIHAEMSVL